MMRIFFFLAANSTCWTVAAGLVNSSTASAWVKRSARSSVTLTPRASIPGREAQIPADGGRTRLFAAADDETILAATVRTSICPMRPAQPMTPILSAVALAADCRPSLPARRVNTTTAPCRSHTLLAPSRAGPQGDGRRRSPTDRQGDPYAHERDHRWSRIAAGDGTGFRRRLHACQPGDRETVPSCRPSRSSTASAARAKIARPP